MSAIVQKRKRNRDARVGGVAAGVGIAAVLVVAACRQQHDTQNVELQSVNSPESQLLHIDTPDKAYLNFPVRILSRSTREALTFDPQRGEPATISYRLTRDGDIRVRVCWRKDKTPVLRAILDWTHQEFGDHEVQWDGRDASGNLVDNTRCFIDILGDSPQHREHESGKCHELELKIVSPTEPEAAIGNLSEIRLELVGDPAYGGENGYELRTYVDYELAAKTELDGDVTAFSLPDVEGLARGQHLITINLDDRHDHVGVAGLRIDVQR